LSTVIIDPHNVIIFLSRQAAQPFPTAFTSLLQARKCVDIVIAGFLFGLSVVPQEAEGISFLPNVNLAIALVDLGYVDRRPTTFGIVPCQLSGMFDALPVEDVGD